MSDKQEDITLASSATTALSNITTTGSIVIHDSPSGSSSMIGPLQVHVPIEEQTTMYAFDIGDLVTYTAEGKHKGKVGQIKRRDLKLACDRQGKEITNIRIVAQYGVDFEVPKEKPKHTTSGAYVFTANWGFNSYTICLEDDLELAFNK